MKKIPIFTIILVVTFLSLNKSRSIIGDDPMERYQISVLAQSDSWPQLQKDANHSGYVSQTVTPPYTELWRVKHFPVSTRVQPVISQDLIFLPSNNNNMYALDTSNGQVVWSYSTNGPLVNTAAYDDGKVFFGSTDNYVYALNASNGNLIWRFKTGSTIRNAPVVAENKVFIGSSDGYMYAIDSDTGNLIWSYSTGAPIYDSAAYDNGKVFFGSLNSHGYGLNASNGNLAWDIDLHGQGFRDRWTVAGNGVVFFTPIPEMSHHRPLNNGTVLFRSDASPVIYNQSWSVQSTAISNYLDIHPEYRGIVMVDQQTGNIPHTLPIIYVSGGSQSSHPQPVLLPNGNANVIYRGNFSSQPSQYGATTSYAIHSGELVTSTGEIIPIDNCNTPNFDWMECGIPITSDESTTITRSGEILYLDVARGLIGLDISNNELFPLIACFNPTSVRSFDVNRATVTFDDYTAGSGGWRIHYGSVYQESSSDGNDTKKPTPIVGDTFYILHLSDLIAVRGTIR